MWITKLGLVMLPLWGGLSIYMPVLANTLATACALEAAEPTCYYTTEVSLAQALEHVGETEPIVGQVDVSAAASSSCVIKIPAWAVAQEANALKAWTNRYLNQCSPFKMITATRMPNPVKPTGLIFSNTMLHGFS